MTTTAIISSIRDIKAPIATELAIFERKFKDTMRSKVSLLDKVMRYIVRRKGKQMRPMFVFFAAQIGGEVTEKTYRGAALVELLHTATLVHDDVVDDAYQRRGFFSINALWKNKIAVLVGDYLLSRGLLLSVSNRDFDLLEIVSRAVKEMSEGELLQMERSRRLNLDEEVYYQIIEQKTASLIASSCKIGYCSNDDVDDIKADLMWQIGEKIGMAFQIRDDLFDFGSDDVGKPKGIDIKEKKLTLPLIYALNHADNRTRKRLIKTIKKDHNDKAKVAEVIDFVWKSGGLEYAQKAMERYRKEAIELLHKFPLSEARTGLEQLIWYATERKK